MLQIYEGNVPNDGVPELRELLWVDKSTYVGVTNDGNLYSLDNNRLHSLNSPIKSAYVVKINQLLLLLENGKLRLIYVDENRSLVDINSSIIDREVTKSISIIQPIGSDIVRGDIVNYSSYFLAVTTSNEFLVISVMYNNDLYRDGMLLLSSDDNPYTAYLNVNNRSRRRSYANVRMGLSDTELTITNNLNIDHQSIRLIRSSYILTYDNRIYYIESTSRNHFILKEYNLDRYNLRGSNIVDMLVRSNNHLIILTDNGNVLLRSGRHYDNVSDFVYRYSYVNGSIVLDDRVIEVLKTDGTIEVLNDR